MCGEVGVGGWVAAAAAARRGGDEPVAAASSITAPGCSTPLTHGLRHGRGRASVGCLGLLCRVSRGYRLDYG